MREFKVTHQYTISQIFSFFFKVNTMTFTLLCSSKKMLETISAFFHRSQCNQYDKEKIIFFFIWNVFFCCLQQITSTNKVVGILRFMVCVCIVVVAFCNLFSLFFITSSELKWKKPKPNNNRLPNHYNVIMLFEIIKWK